MRPRWLRLLVAVAAPVAALTLPTAPTQADPGALVHPGMEIIQGTNVCTLGYVDPQARVAFTAGHCRGNGLVHDRDGHFVGNQALFRDNTPDGATIDTDHQIADWEAISSPPMSRSTTSCRAAGSWSPIRASFRRPVCRYATSVWSPGRAAAPFEAVNNGWFTMANGVVSQKGDSGGPVYVVTPDGRAAIIGMFNSTWGRAPDRGVLADRQPAGQRGRHLGDVGKPGHRAAGP